jgi:hypothetical protein
VGYLYLYKSGWKVFTALVGGKYDGKVRQQLGQIVAR